MRYFKATWDESSVDGPTADWGESTWYFEVGSDNYPIRQVVCFANGQRILYDQEHLDDAFGGLADQPMDPEAWPVTPIEPAEFDAVWDPSLAANRAD